MQSSAARPHAMSRGAAFKAPRAPTSQPAAAGGIHPQQPTRLRPLRVRGARRVVAAGGLPPSQDDVPGPPTGAGYLSDLLQFESETDGDLPPSETTKPEDLVERAESTLDAAWKAIAAVRERSNAASSYEFDAVKPAASSTLPEIHKPAAVSKSPPAPMGDAPVESGGMDQMREVLHKALSTTPKPPSTPPAPGSPRLPPSQSHRPEDMPKGPTQSHAPVAPPPPLPSTPPPSAGGPPYGGAPSPSAGGPPYGGGGDVGGGGATATPQRSTPSPSAGGPPYGEGGPIGGGGGGGGGGGPPMKTAPPGGGGGGYAMDAVMEKEELKLELESAVTGPAASAPSGSLDLPFQSVLEMTSAAAPPMRQEEEEAELAAEAEASEVGTEEKTVAAPKFRTARKPVEMADGQGTLADGSEWERQSGTDYGENGLVCKWVVMRGTADGGKVQWEEKWWEKWDDLGKKELGAEKSGCDVDGGAWYETWTEAMDVEWPSGKSTLQKSAHKWAHSANGDEWEEKWCENYDCGGMTSKTADKWGSQGDQVWHERWGEDFNGQGWSRKWTDRWAEKLGEDGGSSEQWGDKWSETFEGGLGGKSGETWSSGHWGHFSKSWGEEHHGDGNVRKFGSSTDGSHYDVTEPGITHYEEDAHYNWSHAVQNSPVLMGLGKGGGYRDNGGKLDDGFAAL